MKKLNQMDLWRAKQHALAALFAVVALSGPQASARVVAASADAGLNKVDGLKSDVAVIADDPIQKPTLPPPSSSTGDRPICGPVNLPVTINGKPTTIVTIIVLPPGHSCDELAGPGPVTVPPGSIAIPAPVKPTEPGGNPAPHQPLDPGSSLAGLFPGGSFVGPVLLNTDPRVEGFVVYDKDGNVVGWLIPTIVPKVPGPGTTYGPPSGWGFLPMPKPKH